MSKKKYEIVATCYDKRGKIISVGTNSYTRTHPIQARYARLANLDVKQSLHAEIHAIIKSKSRPVHKIRIERYGVDGKPRLAKPCPLCELAIKDAGIKFVEYTVGESDEN